MIQSAGLESAMAAHLRSILGDEIAVRAEISAEEIDPLSPYVVAAVRNPEHEVDELWVVEMEITLHTPGTVEDADPAEHAEIMSRIEVALYEHQYPLMAQQIMAETGALLQGHFVLGATGVEREDGHWLSSLRVRLGIETGVRVAGAFEIDEQMIWTEPSQTWAAMNLQSALYDNRNGSEPLLCTVPAAVRSLVIALDGTAAVDGVVESDAEHAEERIIEVSVGGIAAAGWVE